MIAGNIETAKMIIVSESPENDKAVLQEGIVVDIGIEIIQAFDSRIIGNRTQVIKSKGNVKCVGIYDNSDQQDQQNCWNPPLAEKINTQNH